MIVIIMLAVLYTVHVLPTLPFCHYFRYCYYLASMYLLHAVHAGTAKAGLDMLTKMMSLELGPHKVSKYTVLAISYVTC